MFKDSVSESIKLRIKVKSEKKKTILIY